MTGSPENGRCSGFCGKAKGGHLTRTGCRNCKRQDNRLRQYNFIFLCSLANGNTGNNALLTAIRAISFITEGFSYAG